MSSPDMTTMRQPAAGVRADAQEGFSAGTASRQVVVGDIPVEPSSFQPREDLLAALDRTGARVSVIYAVTGLRGVGATQLAATYARAKREAGWRVVAWVNCADTDSLLAGLAAVADAVGLNKDDSRRSTTDAAAAVRHWLETDGDGCLLVFDDVSDHQVLQAFVPDYGMARVLITTTRQSAGTLGTALPIDSFSPEEASAFLSWGDRH